MPLLLMMTVILLFIFLVFKQGFFCCVAVVLFCSILFSFLVCFVHCIYLCKFSTDFFHLFISVEKTQKLFEDYSCQGPIPHHQTTDNGPPFILLSELDLER